MFDVFDPIGTKMLYQLRVGLSPLKAHKFRHNFIDTPSDICDCTLNEESTRHFLLACPLHNIHRATLMSTITPLLILNDLEDITDVNLVKLLLYGHDSFNYFENKIVIKATIQYLKDSGHFPT